MNIYIDKWGIKYGHRNLLISNCHLCVVASYCFLAPYTIDFLDIVLPLIPDVSSCVVLYWRAPFLVGDTGGSERLLLACKALIRLVCVCGRVDSLARKKENEGMKKRIVFTWRQNQKKMKEGSMKRSEKRRSDKRRSEKRRRIQHWRAFKCQSNDKISNETVEGECAEQWHTFSQRAIPTFLASCHILDNHEEIKGNKTNEGENSKPYRILLLLISIVELIQ